MPSPTRYANGDWNFYCDLCGRKEKASAAMRTWDGFYVCTRHREVRNPQDFVRGIVDDQTVPWSRSKPNDQFPYSQAILQENGFKLLQENGSELLSAYPPAGPTLL